MKLGLNWRPNWQANEYWNAFSRQSADFLLLYTANGNSFCARMAGPVSSTTRAYSATASVVVVAIFGWAFGMTALWEVQRDVIDEKIGQLKDSEVAYGDLLDEILTYQEKVADVTTKLQQKHAYLPQGTRRQRWTRVWRSNLGERQNGVSDQSIR